MLGHYTAIVATTFTIVADSLDEAQGITANIDHFIHDQNAGWYESEVLVSLKENSNDNA